LVACWAGWTDDIKPKNVEAWEAVIKRTLTSLKLPGPCEVVMAKAFRGWDIVEAKCAGIDLRREVRDALVQAGLIPD
jgi:hypothetical protein